LRDADDLAVRQSVLDRRKENVITFSPARSDWQAGDEMPGKQEVTRNMRPQGKGISLCGLEFSAAAC
jgi:hypothetical protein